VISPVNSKPRILDVIQRATTSVHVESLELSDADVIAALVAQRGKGRDVRVLLADPTWDGTGNNAVTARTLDAAGIPTRTSARIELMAKRENACPVRGVGLALT
jgi:hypothetical protein